MTKQQVDTIIISAFVLMFVSYAMYFQSDINKVEISYNCIIDKESKENKIIECKNVSILRSHNCKVKDCIEMSVINCVNSDFEGINNMLFKDLVDTRVYMIGDSLIYQCK